MGCLLEFFGELIGELFLEGFAALGQSAVKTESLSKKQKKWASFAGALIGLAIPVSLFFGVLLLLEHGLRQLPGWLLILFPALLTGWLIHRMIRRIKRKEEKKDPNKG